MRRIESFLEVLVAITLVLNCNSIWARHIIPKENTILLCISIFLLAIMSLRNILRSRKSFFKVSVALIIVNIFNLIFLIYNTSNSVDYIMRFIFILSCSIIYSVNIGIKGELNKLLIKISNVVYILSIISLVIYILAIILKVLPSTSEILLDWGDKRYVKSYYHLLYETQSFSISGINLTRNTGIFTEAPMYAFLLCISLGVKLFIEKKDKVIVYLFPLTFTIFTTFSTIGIVAASILIVTYFLLKKGETKIYSIIKFMIFPVIVIVGITVSLIFIQNRIEGSKYGGGSYSIRVDDFKIGIQVWKEIKLFGIGYGEFEMVQQYVNKTIRGTDIGGSSGIMHILAQGGVYLLLIHLIPAILVIFSSIRYKKYNYLLFTSLIIGLLLITAVQYTFISIYLIAWLISLNILKRKVYCA